MKCFLLGGPSLALTALLVLSPLRASAQQAAWWPVAGSVILEGGNIGQATFDSVARRFITLAGGPEALILIIPTANEAVAPRLRGTGPAYDPVELVTMLKAQGAHHVEVLHTRDRAMANADSFAGRLRGAGGVWIPGGGARILERTYRGTLVERELRALLARGGVIMGDSAGAIAVGCYMLGWTPDPWGVVVEDLGILPLVTVVPHADRAQGYVPADETLAYLRAHPGPIGIVIDENTALVLQRSLATVLGQGQVRFVDGARTPALARSVLKSGEAYDFTR